MSKIVFFSNDSQVEDQVKETGWDYSFALAKEKFNLFFSGIVVIDTDYTENAWELNRHFAGREKILRLILASEKEDIKTLKNHEESDLRAHAYIRKPFELSFFEEVLEQLGVKKFELKAKGATLSLVDQLEKHEVLESTFQNLPENKIIQEKFDQVFNKEQDQVDDKTVKLSLDELMPKKNESKVNDSDVPDFDLDLGDEDEEALSFGLDDDDASEDFSLDKNTDIELSLDEGTGETNIDLMRGDISPKKENEASGELDLGVDELDLGEVELKLGADEIELGADEIDFEEDEIDFGADDLDLGADELDLGAGDLDLGAGDLDLGADELNLGADDLDLGVDDLDLGADELNLGADDLNLGADDLNLEADDLDLGADELNLGADDLNLGADDLNLGAEELDLGADELDLGADDFSLDEDDDLGSSIPEFAEEEAPIDLAAKSELTETYHAQQPSEEVSEVEDLIPAVNENSRSHKEDKEIRKFRENEYLRFQSIIRDLRQEREELVSKINGLETNRAEINQENLGIKSELEEVRIELTIAKKRNVEEIQDLNQKVRVSEERRQISEVKMKVLQQDLSKVEQRTRVNLNQIRQKEQELESQLELISMDSDAKIKARDQKILELKRKIDQLEFNMETAILNERKSRDEKIKLEDRLHRMKSTLEGSIQILEDDLDLDEDMRKKINSLV